MAVQRSGSSIDLRQFHTVDPRMEEVREGELFMIRIHLPGFKKEDLKVQLNSSGYLKVSGERPPQPGGSSNRWTRFRKDIAVPKDCNPDETRAKFSDGVLQVSIPKRRKQEPAQESAPPAPQEQRPPSAEQKATQQPQPSSPLKPQEPTSTKEAQAPASPVPAAEGGEDKDRSKTEKEKEGDQPEMAPDRPKGSDSSPTVDASGIRRRRPFVPKVGYGGGLNTKARGGPVLKTAVALLLLLAGVWLAYVKYRAKEGSSAGSASLAPYPHRYYYGDRI